jgi:hypothetical protein
VYSLDLKAEILNSCRAYVGTRVATAKQAMDDAQRAANSEGKSSAGDKYETGRAMMQIERDRAAHQMQEALQLMATLDVIDPSATADKISLGTLVITDSKRIFISIGIGKLMVSGVEYLVVAPSSPLGKAVVGLKLNDQLVFNKELITVRQIL